MKASIFESRTLRDIFAPLCVNGEEREYMKGWLKEGWSNSQTVRNATGAAYGNKKSYVGHIIADSALFSGVATAAISVASLGTAGIGIGAGALAIGMGMKFMDSFCALSDGVDDIRRRTSSGYKFEPNELEGPG